MKRKDKAFKNSPLAKDLTMAFSEFESKLADILATQSGLESDSLEMFDLVNEKVAIWLDYRLELRNEIK